MKLNAPLLASMVATSALFVSAEATAEKDLGAVVALTDASFNDFLTKNEVSLVEFFAPWCGHCQRLEPEYKKAALDLQQYNVTLAHVDCTQQKEICEKQEIRGYPTLKIFKGAKDYEYGGPRDADGIVKYMKKQIMPAVSTINVHEFNTFAEKEDVVVVGIFAPNSEEADRFKAIAEKKRNKVTFATFPQGIYMVKKFDEGFAKFDMSKGMSEDALDQWINVESTPLMAEVGPENYSDYVESGLPMAFLFYEKEAMRKEYGPIVENAVKSYKGKINAVYIDAIKFEKFAENLAIPKKWPALLIHDVKGDLKYPFAGDFKTETIEKWLKEYTEGKIDPTYRSEEIPEKDDGPVKVVVNKTFEKIVLDEKKDVLLEIYAPWCGACKRIAPVYERLAKEYAQHSDKIIIAKMDGTANDIPKAANIKLEKFPTIVLFKAGAKKEQVELDQVSDKIKVFADFISKHATNKVEVKIEDPKEKEEL